MRPARAARRRLHRSRCSRMPSGWCASARSTRRRATTPHRSIARADVKATHGDLAGARVRARRRLPPAVRAPAEGMDQTRVEAQHRGARRGARACRRRGRRARRRPRHERNARMIRVVVFLVAAGLLALGVVWLADRPGQVADHLARLSRRHLGDGRHGGDRRDRDRGGPAVVAVRACCCARRNCFRSPCASASGARATMRSRAG